MQRHPLIPLMSQPARRNEKERGSAVPKLPHLRKITSYTTLGVPPSPELDKQFEHLRQVQDLHPTIRALREQHPHQFREHQGYIQRRGRDGIWRVIIPGSLQNDIVNYYHSYYGHPGISKKTTIVLRHFTFP